MKFGVANNVWLSLIAIYALLALATFVVFILTKVKKQKNFQELKQRVNSWWVIITIFLLAIVGTKAISVGFLAIISIVAFREFLTILPPGSVHRRIIPWAYLAIILQFYWVYTAWYGMFIIFIPIYLFLFLPMRVVMIGETKDFLRNVSALHWGLMVTVFSISHMAYLLVLPEEKNPAAGNAGLLLFLVFLTQFNDVAQYCWGKIFGKNKITPRVSPNKTWEGFLGAMLTTVAITYFIAPYLTPLNPWQSFIAGLIFSWCGFVGDVVMSAIKRDIGVKDTGRLIPGHGGILDRIDSLTYTAPLFFHLIYYLFY